MPGNRPAIPAEIAREILIESGHRCAVCGAGCPLERAHIIPWHKSREHKAEDLICLCANCHERADKEKWGEKTLRKYKQRPWVMRQYEKADDTPEPSAKARIEIADDRQNQAALEAYFDRMTELLLKEGLRESKEGDEVQSIARTRTLAVLRSLDGGRKGQVVQFLYESGLIGPEPVIVSLNGADLSEADLSEINLIDAHLGGVNLRKANLGGALLCKSWLVETDLDQASLRKTDLRGCNLSGANLAGADLRGAGLEGDSEDEEANLLGVNLDGANLKGAFVSDEQLRCARSLRGTTLPDGTKAPDETTEPTSAQVSEPTPPTIIDKFVYQDTR
jgi:hypothetical protein